jgi:transposase InsO family protein
MCLIAKWIADFTYVWTAEGWLCVAAVVEARH